MDIKDIRSVFSFNKQKIDPEDLLFMDEVDAALVQRGSKWAYILSFLLVGGFCLFLVWSCHSTRNEVTRGEGQVIPSLGVQPIQSRDGGVVNRIYVRENEYVRAGELLVEMSNIDATTGYQDMLNKQVEYRLALKRLDAEATGLPLQFSPEEEAAYPAVVADQLRLYQARRDKYEGDGRELEANLAEKQSSVDEFLAQINQAESSLLLLKEQERRVVNLVRQRLYPEVDYLNLKHRIATAEGELKSLRESLSRTRIEVQEAENSLAGRKTAWDSSIAEESLEYRRQLDSIEERLKSGIHTLDNTELRAPMAGVIRRVLLKEGNVAQRAEAIMELLPTEDILEIEARFKPADRGFLDYDQEASITVTAYDSSRYGTLSGRVISISPDTIEDSKGNSWYEVRLRTNSSKLNGDDGQDLEIKAGMTVTVEVISGEKTVFDYLMKPILKSRQQGRAGIRTRDEGASSESGGSGFDGFEVPAQPATDDLGTSSGGQSQSIPFEGGAGEDRP